MSEETRKKLSISNSIALKGRKLSEEHKRNIGKAVKGRVVSLETRNKLSKAHNGRHYSLKSEFKKGHGISEECKEKIRGKLEGTRMGSDNTSWKGGITPLNNSIRHSFQYRQWRSDVFTRDSFICQCCGYKKGGVLRAHHVKEFNKIVQENNVETYEDAMRCEELWNINNGVTLCETCHIKVHKTECWGDEALAELKKSETAN